MSNVSITLNPNYSGGSSTSLTVESGTIIDLTAHAFSRDGYSISKWSESADGSGESYNGTYTAGDSNATLYAIWRYDYLKPDEYSADNKVDILVSGVSPYAYTEQDGTSHDIVRALFGIKKVNGQPKAIIELRDANNGKFLEDYSKMDSADIGYATIGIISIGNYMIVPHGTGNTNLAIEYIGE